MEGINQGKNAQYKPSIEKDVQPTLVARGPAAVAHTLDCRNGAVNEEISGTIQAKANGGFSYNCVNPVAYAMQAIGEYKESEQASSCKMRDYKDATDLVCETIVLENHPQDSRVTICEDGICQTLNGKMGTGGG